MTALTYVAIAIVLGGTALLLLLPIIIGGAAPSFPIASTDHISSWSWAGIYADGGDKQNQTKAEIERLKAMVGKPAASTYDLYVGIASDYELLGDGKSSYSYLNRAIAQDPKRALAYMNMGRLMEDLGAFATAHAAYDKAVALEPTNPLYQAALQNFLVHHSGTN